MDPMDALNLSEQKPKVKPETSKASWAKALRETGSR